MESSLLFFMIGLAVFFTDRLTKKKQTTIRFLAFILAGLLAGGVLGSLIRFPIFHSLRMPWMAMGLIGGLAGLILFTAAKGDWVSRPGLQYVATVLLGLILAVLSYGLIQFYRIFSRSEPDALSAGSDFIFIAHLFMGFLIIFGYTFPMRWFKLKKMREEKEEG